MTKYVLSLDKEVNATKERCRVSRSEAKNQRWAKVKSPVRTPLRKSRGTLRPEGQKAILDSDWEKCGSR